MPEHWLVPTILLLLIALAIFVPRFWQKPPEPEKAITPEWSVISVLLKLEEAIREDRYREERMVAWNTAVYRCVPPPPWSSNAPDFEGTVRCLRRVMEHKGWKADTIQRFEELIATVSRDHVELLKV